MKSGIYLKPIRTGGKPFKLGKGLKLSKELTACIKDGLFSDLFIIEPYKKKR